MKNGDIIQTSVNIGNCKACSKMRVMEIQEDLSGKKLNMVYGVRILLNGSESHLMQVKINQVTKVEKNHD